MEHPEEVLYRRCKTKREGVGGGQLERKGEIEISSFYLISKCSLLFNYSRYIDYYKHFPELHPKPYVPKQLELY